MKEIKTISHLSDCFNNLPEEDKAFLNSKKIQVGYLKGETIFKQGAFAPYVLFVNQGLAMVYIQVKRTKQINIHLAQRGDYLAFSSIFNENTYKYSAVALQDTTFCMIDKDALKEVFMRNPAFAIDITSKNNINENRYIEIIKNLSYKQMRGKLASAILYLSKEEYKEAQAFEHLTRQNIADFASITVESTVKFLKEFEKDKIIKISGKDIIITDLNRLQDIDLRG